MQHQDSFDVYIDATQFITFVFGEYPEKSDKLLFGLHPTEATGISNCSPYISFEN